VEWVVFALMFLAIVWAVGALWGRGVRRVAAPQRAPNRLNEQGLPRGVTRSDHRRNDEE
jgi:hypothetical protein